MSSIRVIDRATALLEAVCRYDRPVDLKRLAADTGLPQSTAHRVLDALVDNGLISRLERGIYRPGVKLHTLSVGMNTLSDLRAIALPQMENLCAEVGEAVHLTVREGDKVLYVDRVVPPHLSQSFRLIGRRAPLHVTAVGKLWLAQEGREKIAQYAERTNLPAYTSNTITTCAALIQACEECAEKGVGYDHGEAELAVGCVGVLIHDSDERTAAGLSLSGARQVATSAWEAPLIAAANRISMRLAVTRNK